MTDNQIIPAQVVMATSLVELGQQAKAHHASVGQSQQSALKSAIDAGKVLLEAKKMIPHGSFHEWIAANTGIGKRAAQTYMYLAEHHLLLGDRLYRRPMSIREAQKQIGDLRILKEHIPGPGQRVLATFEPDGLVGLLGSVIQPGFIYVAVNQFSTIEPYSAEVDLSDILQFIVKRAQDGDDNGPDSLGQFEWVPAEDAGPFSEKNQFKTVPWNRFYVEPDVILGIEPVEPLPPESMHIVLGNGIHTELCPACWQAQAEAEPTMNLTEEDSNPTEETPEDQGLKHTTPTTTTPVAEPTVPTVFEADLLKILLADPALVVQASDKLPFSQIEHPGVRKIVEGLYRLILEKQTPNLENLRGRLEDSLLDRAVYYQRKGLDIVDQSTRAGKGTGAFSGSFESAHGRGRLWTLKPQLTRPFGTAILLAPISRLLLMLYEASAALCIHPFDRLRIAIPKKTQQAQADLYRNPLPEKPSPPLRC